MSKVKQDFDRLFAQIDGRGTTEGFDAVRKLRVLLADQFPAEMLQRFKTARKLGQRAAYLYHCFGVAKTSADAKQMALLGLRDKSKIVRRRACQLLAYAQDSSLLPEMIKARESIPPESRADLEAAIDAVENENQHYFVDRTHSGKVKMSIYRQAERN
jgi:hypothetical protein